MSEGSNRYRNPVTYLNERMSYLRGQRGKTPPPGPLSDENVQVPGTRCEFEIRGLGREDKLSPTPTGDPRQWRQPFGDLLLGAYTYGMPVSYRITSTNEHGLTLSLGTWSKKVNDDALCIARARVLRTLLGVMYPVVTTTQTHEIRPSLKSFGAGGLILGHPTAKAPVPGDNVLQIDRVIRALGSREWRVSVLSHPEHEAIPDNLRNVLIAEIATAENAEKATRLLELPAVKQFTEVVEPTLRALLEGITQGAWRTAVYLEADATTYPLVASVWRSVFSGDRPTPETIHVMHLGAQAEQLASAWALPISDNASESEYQHPFEYQTLLNSTQLAAYIHLPSVETAGFWVDAIPRFDVSVALGGDEGSRLTLGSVSPYPSGSHEPTAKASPRVGGPGEPSGSRPRPTAPQFSVSLAALSRHLSLLVSPGQGRLIPACVSCGDCIARASPSW